MIEKEREERREGRKENHMITSGLTGSILIVVWGMGERRMDEGEAMGTSPNPYSFQICPCSLSKPVGVPTNLPTAQPTPCWSAQMF